MEDNKGDQCLIKMHKEDGVLTETDIPELVEKLHDVCHKWKIIGIQLGLPLSKLDAMSQKYHSGDCTEIFCHVLQEWMKCCVDHAPPTWAVLLDVLKSKTVGECSLAEELRAMLSKKIVSIHDHEVPTSSNIELCDTNSLADSTSEISSRVHINTATTHDDKRVAGCGFGCSCPKTRRTCASFIKKGCPTPVTTESGFLYLDTSHLTSTERQILEGRLINEFQSINRKFSSMKSSLCQSLIDQKVSVKRLARILADLGAFHSSKPHKPLLQDRLDEIMNAEDIDTVFFIIRDYSSFINFSLIEHIATELGTEKDQMCVQEYQSELENYCRRNIFECPSYHTSASATNQVRLVIKVDSGIETFSLKHQLSFQSRLADIIKVAKHTLQLCSVEKGCIQLTYQIPRFVKEAIFPLEEQQCGELRKMGVMSLSCARHSDHDELILIPSSSDAGDIEKPETNQQTVDNASDVQVGIDSLSSQPKDDSRRAHKKPSRLINKRRESHRLVKQQGHIISEIHTQNLPDDVIEAVLHCLTHEADCPIPQCSCRRVQSKMSDIKAIQVMKSGSKAVEQFEAKKYALPSICVDDIPLSDIDKFVDSEANDSHCDVTEKVRHRQHLDTLTAYDSGLSFDSIVSNDAYQEDL